MTHNRPIARRGAAAGWIILILILAALAGLVMFKMIKNRQTGENTPTTAPDSP